MGMNPSSEHQPELVGPVAQDVGEHPGQGLQLPG